MRLTHLFKRRAPLQDPPHRRLPRLRHEQAAQHPLAARVLGLVSITPEQGARTSLYLATSPEVAGVSGAYFDKCKEVQPSATARDPEQAARLWALSEELCVGVM